MKGEKEVGTSGTKCKAKLKRGQVESDMVLPRGPPSVHDGFPIPLAISRGVGVQCPHPPGKEHCSYMLCLSSPLAHSQTRGPPPPVANVISMLRHPSSICQCPAGLCLHQPTIDSFIWAIVAVVKQSWIQVLHQPTSSSSTVRSAAVAIHTAKWLLTGGHNSADEMTSCQVDYITWRNEGVCILYSSIKVLCDVLPIRS